MNKIAIGFMIFVVLLFVIAIFSNFSKSKPYEEKKSTFHKILEKGLIILIVCLVIVGLVIGYMRLNEADKKKYLKLIREDKDEYRLRYGDDDFYLKKEELKK